MTYSIGEKNASRSTNIINAFDVLLFINLLDITVVLNFSFLVSGSHGKPLVE